MIKTVEMNTEGGGGGGEAVRIVVAGKHDLAGPAVVLAWHFTPPGYPPVLTILMHTMM